MRKLFQLIIILSVFFAKNTSAQDLPDIITEQTSAAHYYYPNSGQIIDDQNVVRNVSARLKQHFHHFAIIQLMVMIMVLLLLLICQ